jgi:hypothetical protein
VEKIKGETAKKKWYMYKLKNDEKIVKGYLRTISPPDNR